MYHWWLSGQFPCIKGFREESYKKMSGKSLWDAAWKPPDTLTGSSARTDNTTFNIQMGERPHATDFIMIVTTFAPKVW